MSNRMILESKGITIDQYFIPPFDLRERELVVVSLLSGPYFQEIKTRLINILTAKVVSDAVQVYQPLTYVPHFKESLIRRHFYPVTVGEYVKKNVRQHPDFVSKIYAHDVISKCTKMNTLLENQRQLINLYATLSNTNHIIFDLIGQGPEGADTSYHIVKEMVKQRGAAILLDNFPDMKNDCTKYLELQILK